jgi:hypothetical protein
MPIAPGRLIRVKKLVGKLKAIKKKLYLQVKKVKRAGKKPA